MQEIVVRDDVHWDDTNRAFIQAFMCRPTLTFEQARPILAAIFSARDHQERLAGDIAESDFNTYVTAANNAISAFDMEIRASYHQKTRAHVFALVNVASDPMSQIATTFSAEEILFLKRVLDTMFEKNNTRRHEVMAIRAMDAMQLNRPQAGHRGTMDATETHVITDRGITKTQAEEMLDALEDQGWFERSKTGYYSLAPRALMELRGWLMETYNDPEDEAESDDQDRRIRIKTCRACKGIVTEGQRCSKLSCNCRVHDICMGSLFRMQRNRQCPDCQSEWTGNDFVGERADLAKSRSRNSNTTPPTPIAARDTGEQRNPVQQHPLPFNDLYDVDD